MKQFRPAFPIMITVIATIFMGRPLAAWGPEGHRVVGLLAARQLTPDVKVELRGIVGSDDPVAMAELCNWPDAYRATDAGAWSALQHYINVPPHAHSYERARDCVNGSCSAEAFKKYAGELGDSSIPGERRWQAWAWVCHLAGEIHQPLHNGYAHDRGGNDFEVVYRGREMNLHHFWDHALLSANYADWTQLTTDLAPLLNPGSASSWRPEQVDGWVVESHKIVKLYGYPDTPEITQEFAAERWLLARSQLALAATRLAAAVNTELGDTP
jgi:hypothetical protein